MHLLRPSTRRTFIRHVGYAGAVLPLAMPRLVRAVSPNGKLNIAGVGVAGKGWPDINDATGLGELHNLTAICDIDHRHEGKRPANLGAAQKQRPLGLGAAREKFPSARVFADFRRMFDEAHKEIDAVTVTTPDHMHATIALTAMGLGKHVFVQKPMAQTVHEARVMRLVAAQTGVVTQMGNQHHASIGYRCLVELIRGGAIGKVREAHAWTSSPTWPQGIEPPTGTEPVPEGVHWDLWCGVSEPRPFKQDVYHPFNWRGWRDFGGGAQGDMGCHIMDPVVWSLDLQAPLTVQSLGPAAPNEHTFPAWTTIRYEFPSTPHTAAATFPVTWYDGGKQPPIEIAQLPEGQKLPTDGSLYVGEKGVAVIAHTPTIARLYPEPEFRDYTQTTLRELYKTFEPLDHHRLWTDAIQSGGKANSNFGYAGPLTETVQMGNIANRFPNQVLYWDSSNLRFTNEPRANDYIRRPYRKGWQNPSLA